MLVQKNESYFNNINQNKCRKNKEQSFKGAADVLTAGMQALETYPMVKVGFVDTVSTNIPRTVVDLKTGIPAALETARREFSGLIVNCLIPSFFVLGAAKLINKPIMKNFKDTNLSNSWANQNTIEKLSQIYTNSSAANKTKSFVAKTLASLEGFDGDAYVPFVKKFGNDNFKKAINTLTDAINNPSMSAKETKKAINSAYKNIVSVTHAAETIKFKGDKGAFTSNLAELLRDQVDLGRKFIKPEVANNFEGFKKAAVKMVNTKSLLGLAVIIPLAMSVQSINRAITRHKYKQKGAPIYKDFEKGNTYKEMTPAEKTKFFGQKCFSASLMLGLAVLSMMKKPNLKMFQFKGMFPTLDQCRWIAASTFISRMFASEDPNELRESTVRDIASFSGLYFLGDYAEKGAATLIEKIKPDVKIINRLKPDDKTASYGKRFWNWVKNYKLKSFDEVVGQNAKNMRSAAQLAGLAFSVIGLGILLPKYNRHVTEKKVARQKEAEALTLQNNQNKPSALTNYLDIQIPETFKGMALK